jgi:hypothetical protein
MAKGNSQKTANGSALDFEAQLWDAAEQAVPVARLESLFDVAQASSPAGSGGVPAASWNTGRGRPANPPPGTAALHSDSFRADLHPDLKTDLVPVRKDLANPPSNMSDWGGENWTRPYTRKTVAFPAKWLRESQFWPHVSRVDNVFGDRNPVCSCAGMENYS